MPDTKKLDSSVIKYEGVFDWEKLYKTIVSWFKSNRFDYYEKKNVKKLSTYGYDLEYAATAEREETAYIKYTIKIEMKAANVEEVEVIEKGEKKKVLKAGLMSITILPILDMDWNNKWEGSEFAKKSRNFLHKHIMRRKVEEWMDKIYYEAYHLQTKIKEVLDLSHKYSAYERGSKKIISQ